MRWTIPVIALACLAACATPAYQAPATAQTPQRPTAEQDSIVSLWRRGIFEAEPYTVKYDRFTDETSVTTTGMLLSHNAGGLLYAIATFKHGGQELKAPPDAVWFVLQSQTQGWVFLQSALDLHLLVDGERLPLGEMERVGEVGRGGRVTETLMVLVPREDFERIAAADSVEGRVGRVEFSFREGQLPRWRSFAEYWSPSDSSSLR